MRALSELNDKHYDILKRRKVVHITWLQTGSLSLQYVERRTKNWCR